MMKHRMMALLVLLGASPVTTGGDAVADASARETYLRPSRDDDTTRIFRLLGKNASWSEIERVRMPWRTFHTQGLVKVGDTFFVSAVEVLEARIGNGTTTDALYDFSIDRSAGKGRGWLFKFDAKGALLEKLELGQGDIYHPGGIDFDGHDLWVPVCEYRPNSRSLIYRVDPETLTAELVFSETDAIGAIVRNRHDGSLHGVSWGSRRLYTWSFEPGLLARGSAPRAPDRRWQPNPQFYIDYQDCHYQGVEFMLCAGVGSYSTPLGPVAFGGIDLVDLRDQRMLHQIPVNAFVDEGRGENPGLSLTNNAFWAEPAGNGSLRVYFMTESNEQADLLVYEAAPWVNRGQ